MSRIAVLGAGYVGLTTAVAFALDGHEVRLYDTDAAKLEAVRSAKAPFYEPGLDEALDTVLGKGLAPVEALADVVDGAEFVFLCVGTPSREDGSLDASIIEEAARQVAKALAAGDDRPLVVVKSTVLPGTTERLLAPALEEALGSAVRIAVNPEFLKEGSALADARDPDRVVLGVRSEADEAALRSLYPEEAAPVFVVDLATAEMVKYAANAFLALKVGFANEMANVAERVRVDWYDVIEPMGADSRINPRFFRAGVGFGGSCFPKDVRALAALARAEGRTSRLLEALLEGNDAQSLRAVALLEEELGDLKGKRVALLGLAFKPETDDVRETRALPIYRALVEAGAEVVCNDPMAGENFRRLAPEARVVEDVLEALEGADGCIVQTEWQQYRDLGAAQIVDRMRTPVVVDGRRTLDERDLSSAGVRYRRIG